MGRQARTLDTELSFTELNERWTPLMHKFATRCSSPDYDDVMQELRIRLWRAQRGFNPSKGARFGTYLYRAFDNAVKREYYLTGRRPKSDSFELKREAGFDIGYNDSGYELAEMASIVGSTAQELDRLAETAEKQDAHKARKRR